MLYGYNYYGVSQYAYATGGDASASLTNSGTLNIAADAVANGATDAYAYAYNDDGISQEAYVEGTGNASVALDNSGTLNITANGAATAGTGSAHGVWLRIRRPFSIRLCEQRQCFCLADQRVHRHDQHHRRCCRERRYRSPMPMPSIEYGITKMLDAYGAGHSASAVAWQFGCDQHHRQRRGGGDHWLCLCLRLGVRRRLSIRLCKQWRCFGLADQQRHAQHRCRSCRERRHECLCRGDGIRDSPLPRGRMLAAQATPR